MPSTLHSIVESGLCHGCGGCAASLPAGRITISMTDDGFLRPVSQSPLTSDEMNVVEQVCSGAALQHEKIKPDYNPLWGPIIASRVGYSSDPELRYAGSSGGVLSSISAALLDSGEVDFVLQVAASFGDPIGNTPRPSDGRVDVIEAAGSRYAPSATLADLELHLASGLRFAVVGKPCDIATLRRMAQRDVRIDKQIPYMLSFMCAGVPSRKGTYAVLRELGATYEELTSFSYRGRGWPGYTRAILASGEERSMTYKQAWGGILSRYVQPRCKICPDGTGEFADIVCADAWYGKDGYPDFSEAEGRSMILARTQAGEALIQRLLANDAIVANPLSVSEIGLMQPYQENRKRMVLARLLGLKLLGRRTPRYRKLSLVQLSRKSSLKTSFRNFAGTFVRATQGKFNA